MLIAQHRRARVVNRANQVRQKMDAAGNSASMDRMKLRVMETDSENAAMQDLLKEDSLESNFAALEREDRIEQLLRELKERQSKTA
jgi:phage shock protein A